LRCAIPEPPASLLQQEVAVEKWDDDIVRHVAAPAGFGAGLKPIFRHPYMWLAERPLN